MNMTEFVNDHADREKGKPLDQAGPLCRRLQLPLFDPINHAERISAVLASAFWDAFLHSAAWKGLVVTDEEFGLPWGSMDDGLRIVVPRPNLRRFDLLVLHPAVAFGVIRHRRIERSLKPDILVDGWIAAAKASGPNAPMQTLMHPGMGSELLQSDQPFALILAALPTLEPTCVPASATDVRASRTATAGIVAKFGNVTGVTASHHVVLEATDVRVASSVGKVLSNDPVSDSSFVELTTPLPLTNRQLQVMGGMLPRGQQNATFAGYGRNNNPVDTVITSWDAHLPNVAAHRQSRLYTRLDTKQGDSGASLITDDDYVVGFALDFTPAGHNPEFSSWIWADSVVQAHGLVV